MLLQRKQQICLVLGVLLRIHRSTASVNSQLRKESNVFSHTLRGGVLRDSERPFWILEDRVPYKNLQHQSKATKKPSLLEYNRRGLRRQKKPNSGTYKRLHSIQLPINYLYPERPIPSRAARMSQQNPSHQGRKQAQKTAASYKRSMPHFDNLPGEDTADPVPVFVYSGTKGELLLNTMLSSYKYPMLEPVPGQVLYPPTTPIFRPKPILQHFRDNKGKESVNITLIPFYVHEAIDPSSQRFETNTSADMLTSANDLYVEPAAAADGNASKRRRSRWQDYKVYHSRHEVQWQPSSNVELPTTTTPLPLSLSSPPLHNHRSIDMNESSTALPNKTSTADEAGFKIVYWDESLEKTASSEEAPTPSPLHSSRYSGAQETYAFPIFSLGGLFKRGREAQLENVRMTKKEMKKKEDDSTETWIVLNSRYKQDSRNMGGSRLSSKYVQNSVTKN